MTSIRRMMELADAKAAAKAKAGRPAAAAEKQRPAAREAVGRLPGAPIKFLMKIPASLSDRLEKERVRLGLRSRVATILAVLEQAVPK